MPFVTYFLLSYAKFLRRTRAAITIQKFQRMYVVRKRYQCMRDATIALQALLRGYMVRNKYQMVRNHYVLILHSSFNSTYLEDEAASLCPPGNLDFLCGCCYVQRTNEILQHGLKLGIGTWK